MSHAKWKCKNKKTSEETLGRSNILKYVIFTHRNITTVIQMDAYNETEQKNGVNIPLLAITSQGIFTLLFCSVSVYKVYIPYFHSG